jgi:methylthioribose-1-phosphate isomerase
MLGVTNIAWAGDAETGHLRLLDQRVLPEAEQYLDCRAVEDVFEAIRTLAVRGAPAIGIAAAYGCVLGTQGAPDPADALARTADRLAESRPTAVNLFWALDRMRGVEPAPATLLAEARALHEEDAVMCRRIGEHAVGLLDQRLRGGRGALLTHCNAGALATGGIGTATAGMYLARERGLPLQVYADETRPLLQGSRLTAFELGRAGIDVTLICDDAAAEVMREGRVDAVITGADRIAANGDTANKIGTYNLAVLARHHGIRFYVAAPSATFDLTLPSGDEIPIEQRAASEITSSGGRRTAPEGTATYSPAFDVTPASLIEAVVTERGAIEPVEPARIRAVVGGEPQPAP